MLLKGAGTRDHNWLKLVLFDRSWFRKSLGVFNYTTALGNRQVQILGFYWKIDLSELPRELLKPARANFVSFLNPQNMFPINNYLLKSRQHS
jgi:hypothetical protein